MQFASLEGSFLKEIALVARTRSRNLSTSISGFYQNMAIVGSPPVFVTQLQRDETTTDDTVGWWDLENPFNSIRLRYEIAKASGVKRSPSTGNITMVVNGLPLANNVLPPALPSPPSALEMDWAAREIQAGTNPSLPDINSVTSAGEAKDLAGLLHSIRQSGWGLLKALSAGYVTYRFVALPMMSDLRTLTRLARLVDDRTRELKRLKEGKELRRRVDLGTVTTYLPDVNVTLNSGGAFLPAVAHRSITVHRWGSARWKLSSNAVLPDTNDELRKFARRLATGATTASALRTLWELFPWSWFIDWFGQYSQIMESADRSVPLTIGPMCLMETTVSINTYTPRDTSTDDWDWITLSGTHAQHRTRKWRHGVSTVLPIVLPRMPILTDRHWSILGALAGCRLAPNNGLVDKLLGDRTGGNGFPLGRRARRRLARMPRR